MKYMIAAVMVLIFTIPLAMAQGGGSPAFETLYEQSRMGKQEVVLIDASSDKRTLDICLRNIAQNTVVKKHNTEKMKPC